MQDDTIKEKVLGKINKPKPTGGFYVTEKIANSPLFYEGSVVRCFCLGCGGSTELVLEGAQRLSEKARKKVLENWEGFYFESSRCIVCDQDYKNVALKKIK